MKIEKAVAQRRKEIFRAEEQRWDKLKHSATEAVLRRDYAELKDAMAWAGELAEAAYPTENINEKGERQ